MLSEFVVIAFSPPPFCGKKECAYIDMGKIMIQEGEFI